MAGTTDNITADDWWLASAELAFVTELVGSQERALEVMDSLLDDLAKGLIRWDCAKFTVDGDFHAYPALRTTYATARGRAFFWHRDEHSRVDVDWLGGYVAWVGPLAGFGSDGMGNSWPIFDPCASTSLTASGVRFHHGNVVARLVARGLMPRPATSPPPSLPPEIAPAMLEETAPTSVLLPDNPTAILAALELNGFQQEAIAEGVLEIYGRNSPESLTPGKLRKDLRARHKVKVAEAKARGDTPPDAPAEWDACNDFVTALRAWRVKQCALNS